MIIIGDDALIKTLISLAAHFPSSIDTVVMLTARHLSLMLRSRPPLLVSQGLLVRPMVSAQVEASSSLKCNRNQSRQTSYMTLPSLSAILLHINILIQLQPQGTDIGKQLFNEKQ